MMKIEVDGLTELSKRMSAFPNRYRKSMHVTLRASIDKIWEITGQVYYPSKPPMSTYDRTGNLGRSLGTSEHGGKHGRPSIYNVRTGGSYMQAELGTNIKYAPYVIGDRQARQNKHWKKLDPDVANKAEPEIINLFEKMVEVLSRWLDGKGA